MKFLITADRHIVTRDPPNTLMHTLHPEATRKKNHNYTGRKRVNLRFCTIIIAICMRAEMHATLADPTDDVDFRGYAEDARSRE